jgi:riboflavin kinase/FMN adenylyltransferase
MDIATVYSIEDVRGLAPAKSAVTLGVFDGVHAGHQRTIDALVSSRKRGSIEKVYVITFDPHPLVITHSRMTPPMLTTIDERVYLLSRFNVDGIVVLPFDEHLANVDYRTFLKEYLLAPFDMKLLVLGYDCHFGKNREGSPERVAREANPLGFEVQVVPPLSASDEVVSSTKIRNALTEGDLERANRLLGHSYLISGKVIQGHNRGAELGFPTANLAILDPYKLWPPRGVYAVEVEHRGNRYGGMMNIGSAPTIKNLDEAAPAVEVHLFDFNGDIYGETLRVFCRKYLRQERRFSGPEALVEQLHRDRAAALECLEADREPG